MQFAHDNWYIEGDIDQQFPSINHRVLVKLLETKISDQAFIDLIYKYLKVGYGKSSNKITPKLSWGQSGRSFITYISKHLYDTF